MNSGELVFVYGSLKRGYALAGELAEQQFVMPAVTEPEYCLYDCGHYPGLTEAADDGQAVVGEVYCVTATCLQRLDLVEAVAEGLYERRRIRLQGILAAAAVWAYFYLPPVTGLRACGPEWPDSPGDSVSGEV